ncbi:hypothetical protein [Marinagarivorans cellulosilyticus]|uniref:Uncharacterized protein n=1 Tax=Marinagarivorans cellulosilyticus TaxID=2721545 RepID=A0AAN2BK03_9GAMM|nr:hypothetical protein [Marinagarivorans cellulosilyticus]BCD97517.1 hypothetical protein MARGE09_P1718 [Marinagarivorans cellulosilyticus]
MSKRKKSTKKVKPTTVKVLKKYRNTVSQNPLLRKGGVHEKSHKALRTSAKRELRAKARDSLLRCA